MKLWWPHLEALIATARGYQLTGDEEMFNWFEKIHDYTWDHFPDAEHGEWFGYLARDGKVNNECKANQWKACFHLPRALYMISDIFSQVMYK
jgi:N-acylglucosamine 2-epimerase